jgi:ribonuclease P/MRP protein subunit RPP40
MNNRQFTGAVFIDLSKAFDLVSHEILLSKLNVYLSSPNSLMKKHVINTGTPSSHHYPEPTSLFRSYFDDRHQQVFVNGQYSTSGSVTRGVPQGSVLGPLLFCVFINDLPLHVRDDKITCDLFADDATIHTPDTCIKSVNKRLQQSLSDISSWCESNSMILNPSKTECMTISTRQKHQLKPLMLDLSIQSHTITQVTEHRLLGVIIDNQMKWQSHLNSVCKTVSRNVFMLSKLKHLIDSESRKLFYNAHIKTHIDYASTLWDCTSDVHLKRLNSLQRRAVKQILPSESSLSTDQKLEKLQILPLPKHLLYNKGVVMFKIWNGFFPEYLCKLFTKSDSGYSTSRRNFIKPRPRIDIFKTSLSFSGSSFWNTLPSSITHTRSLSSFKESLFKHLLRSLT